jgi:hypothetical protein
MAFDELDVESYIVMNGRIHCCDAHRLLPGRIEPRPALIDPGGVGKVPELLQDVQSVAPFQRRRERA